MLSETQVQSFQALYKKSFGKDITREEAYEKGVKLLRLVELTYRPITQQEYDELQKRLEEIKDL
jgi:hypothetical protein